MMMTGGSPSGRNSKMRTIRRSAEERHRARFAQELADAGGRARIAPDDLAGDDAVERQVAQLEDLAHAAGAEPLDRLEAVELRQGRVGRRCRRQVASPVERTLAVEPDAVEQ